MQFQVRNQLQEIVSSFDEPAYGPFLSFCRKAELIGVRYVDFIVPDESAMLNNFQLKAWLQDFPAAIDEIPMNSIQRADVLEVLEAARHAEAIDGYLFIED